jgi:hypothetical protein
MLLLLPRNVPGSHLKPRDLRIGRTRREAMSGKGSSVNSGPSRLAWPARPPPTRRRAHGTPAGRWCPTAPARRSWRARTGRGRGIPTLPFARPPGTLPTRSYPCAPRQTLALSRTPDLPRPLPFSGAPIALRARAWFCPRPGPHLLRNRPSSRSTPFFALCAGERGSAQAAAAGPPVVRGCPRRAGGREGPRARCARRGGRSPDGP